MLKQDDSDSFDKYAYRAYVKDIFLELPDYEYYHKPYDIKKPKSFFVGREKIAEHFLNILRNSSKSGAYLVTGYRGMGKTSFVNRVLERYENSIDRIRLIHTNISLNQNELNEVEIFKNIAYNLKSSINKNYRWLQPTKILSILFPIIFFILALITHNFRVNDLFLSLIYLDMSEDGTNIFRAILTLLLLTVIIGTFLYSVLILLIHKTFKLIKVDALLSELIKRCESELINEEGAQGTGNLFPIGFITNQKRKYNIATPKEIENELINIIDEINKNSNTEVIFVFDELDKVESAMGRRFFFEDMESFKTHSHGKTYLNDYRERKQLIINILASLKHFITTAKARFIFIAGREMFDAALADIADRQSSVGSIFNQVINVDSLLKEKINSPVSTLTNLIEEHLKNILLGVQLVESQKSNQGLLLRAYYDFLKNNTDLEENQIRKIIFCLQNFVIYLTYRSNGAPQKIARLIEEVIVNKEYVYDLDDPKKTIKVMYPYVIKYQQKEYIRKNKSRKQKLFLSLQYNEQYKYSYISYLYRPFILSYGKYIKDFSDQLIVSTPYLMDHLMKFHPFAFSINNLELLPEILTTNRVPLIRYFTEQLVAFLSENILRPTEVGLFEYKFFNKASNEIIALSKMFEEESAAFNFTLDESYYIKLHLRVRIKELRSIYKEYWKSQSIENEYVFSISFLNNLLGDAHFFDQEYNDSIIAYQDALQPLRLAVISKGGMSLSTEKYVLLIKLYLKLGLTYEKMKSYDEAYSYYSTILKIFKLYHTTDNNDNNNDSESRQQNKIEVDGSFFNPEVNHLTIQGSLAELFLYEKFNHNGINIHHLATKLEWLDNSIDKTYKFGRASFLINLGTLSFFKNMIQSSLEVQTIAEYLPIQNDFRKQLEEIHAKNIKHSTFRNSPYSYECYTKALANLLEINENIELISLILKCVKIAKSDDGHSIGNYSTSYLNKLANSLTRIGDVILSYLPDGQRQTSGIQHDIVNVFPDKIYKNLEEGLAVDIIHHLDQSLLVFDEKEKIISIPFLVKLYYLSGKFYMRAGRSVSCSFQLRKILHVIRATVNITPKKQLDETEKKFFYLLKHGFLAKILEIVSWNSNSSDRPQIDKFKYYFKKEGNHHPFELSRYIYKNLSSSPEVKEALLFYAAVSIKSRSFNLGDSHLNSIEETIQYEEQSLVDDHNGISSQFSRILELSFQVTVNNGILKTLIKPKLIELTGVDFISAWTNELFFDFKNEGKSYFNSKESLYTLVKNAYDLVDKNEAKYSFLIKKGTSPSQFKKFARVLVNYINSTYYDEEIKKLKNYSKLYVQLTTNSIFCLTEIIRKINVVGVNYMLSNSFLADYHRRLSTWMKHYSLCKELDSFIYKQQREVKTESDTKIEMLLKDLIGVPLLSTLNSTSQAQLALQYYYKAIQVHNEGIEYKVQTGNMIYLEDDFNDNLYHYCAAIERQQINSGRIRKYIDQLTVDIRNSQLIKPERYMNNNVD
jgi:hypothetical protein